MQPIFDKDGARLPVRKDGAARVAAVLAMPGKWSKLGYRELAAALTGEGGAESNRYKSLCRLLDDVTSAPLPLDTTDAQICILAEQRAGECMNLFMEIHRHELVRPIMENIVRANGLAVPIVKDDQQAVLRIIDAAWWRKGMRKAYGRMFEAVAIRLGQVSIRAGAYASEDTVKRRAGQVARNKAILESVAMVNEHGAEFTLKQLANKGTANKRIRRGELMLRLAGCEDVANEAGHVGVFVTLTAPSKYHAVLQKSGTINEKYQGATPRQVQAYLQTTWARIRAAYGRVNIKPYGFRIAEPHHDGCVHWHALVFMPKDHVDTFCEIVKRHALAEDGDEPGAQSQRVKFELIDSAKGSAAAYIAKYISKNIDDDDDNHDEVTDENGNVVKFAVDKASARVDAWAGVWGIRQFQPIGQPPVTVWRELRRVGEGEVKGATGRVRAAWDAAQRVFSKADEDGVCELLHAANFGDYIRAQGGVNMGRDYAIKLAVEPGTIYGRYGAHDADAPVGIYEVSTPLAVYKSTRYTWTRRPAAVAVGAALDSPWSPVNNCTVPHWAEGAMPGELVAAFDDEWFKSDEYQKFFVPPVVVAEEWHAAELAAQESRAKTVWTKLSPIRNKGQKHA